MPTIEEIDAADVAKDVEKAYGEWFKRYMRLFLRRALEWFIVYLFGYYNASFGWLMAPLFFLVLRDKRAKEKKIKFDIIRNLCNRDEKDILQEIQRFANLPSWVTFPDMERVEWLNKIMKQLWPYAGQYARDLCKTSIEPVIYEALKAYKISGFKFEKIILGDTPPRFSGMKVYDDTSRHEIIMDTDFVYAGDCKFEVSVSKFRAGIKDLQISGRIRVVMKPLVRQIPLVGGLQVFFLNNPDVDFNLIGVADLFDMPGLSDILRSIVIEQIANMMVLPNRYPIQLVQDINVVELKCPTPAGVIRLHVIEAKNLMKKDIGVMGMGKSDPYCILNLGAQKFQTKTINNTVNPKWDFCCEFIIEKGDLLCMGVFISVSVLDDDILFYDKTIDRANLDVQSIYDNGEIDMWVPLSEAKSGRLHIKATWMDLCDAASALEEQLNEIRTLQNMTKNPLHSAVLLVWIDSAKKLNPSHKSIPDPFVRLHVGNTKEETTVRHRTNDPVFEEGFTFLVRNPTTQELQAEVFDQKTNHSLGKLDLDLNILLKEKKLESIGEEFTLSGSAGGMAALKLTLTLRILKTSPKMGSLEIPGSPKKGEAEEITLPTSAGSTVPVPPFSTPTDLTHGVLPPDSGSEKVDDPSIVHPHPPMHALSPKETAEVQLKPLLPAVQPEGEVTLPSLSEPESGPVGASSPEMSIRQREVSSAGEHGLGRIQLTVKYSSRNVLSVVIHRVENLPKEEDGEIPDPYVKLYLLPDRSKDTKRKTDIIKDDCNPIYDEKFEYTIVPNELTKRTLQVSVINKKGFFHLQKSAMMGQVHIDCGLLDPNQPSRWYDLNPAMDEGDD